MEFLNAIGLLLTCISILIGVYVFKRQMNAQLFLEYTKRYEEIVRSYPDGARGFRLHTEGEPPPESSELTMAVLRYLNLCSEEFYLRQGRYFSDGIWQIWEKEMLRTLASPLYLREWQKVKGEFASYREFLDYVSKSQSKRSA